MEYSLEFCCSAYSFCFLACSNYLFIATSYIKKLDDPTTKNIKKILREKHPGYEKYSIDGEAFDSACETISFYLTRGKIKEARAILNVMSFVPISLSEKEIDNIIQEYSKKKR